MIEHGPMALLADSQLLLGAGKTDPVSDWVARCIRRRGSDILSATQPGTALYIGAANGNVPEFYEMAVDICQRWDIDTVYHVVNESQLTQIAPKEVDAVILSGGDVALGWSFLRQKTVRDWLDSYSDTMGPIIGTSAGAIHLASAFSVESHSCSEFLGYYPACIVAHEEKQGWPTVQTWRRWKSNQIGGGLPLPLIGIPFGGGMLIDSEGERAVGNGFEVF